MYLPRSVRLLIALCATATAADTLPQGADRLAMQQDSARFQHREMRLREAVERGDISQAEAENLRRLRQERQRIRQESVSQRQSRAEPFTTPTPAQLH